MEWLPEGDLAYFILDLVGTLDLGGIERKLRAKDPRGTRPYAPQMMVALLLYGYCVGVMSSRKLEQATYRDVAFRVLAGGHHPDHDTIAGFRRQFLDELQGLFVQSVQLAQRAGLVKLGRVAIDGTKLQANASKHKAMSYERMVEAEAKLRKEIAELLEQAEQCDQREDAEHGRNRRGDELPAELQRRETRLEKIMQAKAALEAEAARTRVGELERQAQQAASKAETCSQPVQREKLEQRADEAQAAADELRSKHDIDDDPPPPSSPAQALPSHRVPAKADGSPSPKAQRSFTDPDSRIMKRDGTFLQGYNCHAAVDDHAQIIVACATTNQAPDVEHFVPMLEQVHDNCGLYPDESLGDAGYWSERNVAFCEERGIDPYIATGRLHRGEHEPPARGRPPNDLSPKQRMARKLRTKKGKKVYARRKVIAEPPFGQIKEARGIKRFLLRGLEKVSAEWALIAATHNILKLFRSGKASPLLRPAAA
jgi:transposase